MVLAKLRADRGRAIQQYRPHLEVYAIDEHPTEGFCGSQLATLTDTSDLEKAGSVGAGGKVDVWQKAQGLFEVLGLFGSEIVCADHGHAGR